MRSLMYSPSVSMGSATVLGDPLMLPLFLSVGSWWNTTLFLLSMISFFICFRRMVRQISFDRAASR